MPANRTKSARPAVSPHDAAVACAWPHTGRTFFSDAILRCMKRRTLLHAGLAAAFGAPLLAALRQDRLDEAADVLAKSVAGGQVTSAVLHVTQREASFTRRFGQAASDNAVFLLGSITKPICVTALMTLFDRGEFRLDD